jgi:hypothetical protein
VKIGLPAVLLLVVLAALAIAWYFASVAIAVDHGTDYSLRVVDVRLTGSGDAGTVTITRSDDAARRATFGLVWRGGRAVLDPPVGTTSTTVTRPIHDVTGTPPSTPTSSPATRAPRTGSTSPLSPCRPRSAAPPPGWCPAPAPRRAPGWSPYTDTT